MKWCVLSFMEILFFQSTFWVFLVVYIIDVLRFVSVPGQKSLRELFLRDSNQSFELMKVILLTLIKEIITG